MVNSMRGKAKVITWWYSPHDKRGHLGQCRRMAGKIYKERVDIIEDTDYIKCNICWIGDYNE